MCPLKVVKTLDYLMKNSELYKNENIHINDQWMNALSQAYDTSAQDVKTNFSDSQSVHQKTITDENNDSLTDEDQVEFCESDTNEALMSLSTDTMLDDISNMSITFAPGEGKKPVFHDPLVEYMAFPRIHCGRTHPENKDRIHPIQQRDIFKNELQSVDT